MAKKAIKPKKEPTHNGSAETNNSQITVVQGVNVEVVKTPTLEELESAAEAALTSFRECLWAFAVAVTAIHDSGLYEGAGEPNGFYLYMEQRWGIRKAQGANYVAWVKHEIKVELVSQNPVLQLEDIKSNQLDSNVTPPPKTPRDKGTAASRKSRSKRAPGKLNEEDTQELLANGSIVKVGDLFYSKGTPEFEAEMARRASQNGDSEPKADYLKTKKKAIANIKAAQKTAGDNHSANIWLDDVGMEAILEQGEGGLVQYMQGVISREDYLAGVQLGTRPTAALNPNEVTLTDEAVDDDSHSGYVIEGTSKGDVARFEVVLPGSDDMEIPLVNQAEAILRAFIELNLKNGRITSAEQAFEAFDAATTCLKEDAEVKEVEKELNEAFA